MRLIIPVPITIGPFIELISRFLGMGDSLLFFFKVKKHSYNNYLNTSC